MNKKDFLKTYKKIDQLSQTKGNETEYKPSIYRSEHDERLIKEMHYAKFQKNLQHTQQSESFKHLVEKENWNDEDVQALLKSLR